MKKVLFVMAALTMLVVAAVGCEQPPTNIQGSTGDKTTSVTSNK